MSEVTADVGPKNAIVRGAFAALMKQGLPTLSYDSIAREAGLSRQLVRYHFKDPETLMLSVCDFLSMVYREALLRSVSQKTQIDRLTVFLDFYFDLLDEEPKPRDDQVYDALMSLAANSNRIRKNLRHHYTMMGEVISHELQMSHPNLTLPAARELSYLIVSLMYGHWKMVASLGLNQAHKRAARAAIDRLIRSYIDEESTKLAPGEAWS